MKMPSRSAVIAVVAAAAVSGGFVAVRPPVSCRPDPDQGEIIEPFTAVPQLVREPAPPAPPTPGPSLRSYPVVDGPELHVVALPTATLRPVDGHFAGTVVFDIYNSGRQPYTYIRLRLALPAGVRWESPSGYPTQEGCVGSPAEWVCSLDPIPAGRGRAWLPLTVVADVAPGSGLTTIDGLTLQVMGADANNADLTDLTPEDNRAQVRLRLDES